MADTRYGPDDPKGGDLAGDEQVHAAEDSAPAGHDDDARRHEDELRAAERESERARRRAEEREAERERAAALRARMVRLATAIVSIVSAVFAVALALHIVFVVFGANPENPLVSMVADLSDSLVVFFRDLFTPDDDRVGVLVNHGMAAIFWLVLGRIVVAALRRIP